MMDSRMKAAIERTRDHLVRHLEDLNDEIDQDNGRIKDHMVVDGLKDSLKSLKYAVCLLNGNGGEGGNGGTEVAEQARTVSPLR